MGAEIFLAGVDVGGTKIAVGLATPDGTLVRSARVATRPERGGEAAIAEAVGALRDLAGGARIARLGIASAGPLDLEAGTMESPPNFAGWGRVPLVAPFSQAFGAPVVLDNDANAAALAEYTYGAGRGAEILVYVTLSTGIGGGLVVHGRLLQGLGWAAGELGHQTLQADGPLCGCGNRGCFEALASGTAIARRARALVERGQAPGLAALVEGDLAALHAGHVAAAAGYDADASALWDETIELLAIGLGNVVTTLAPDRLVLGGGVAAIGDRLLVPLKAALARRVRMLPIERLDLRLSEQVHEAGLLGAIALAASP